MAYYLDIKTIEDPRGKLGVIEAELSFPIRRIYFMYDVVGCRGGHSHKKTRQALVCLTGRCEVHVSGKRVANTFSLDSPTKALILEPSDWHTMESFLPGTVLLVLASRKYDPKDYVYEKPS